MLPSSPNAATFEFMPSFEPIAEKNSIQEAVFALHLAQAVEPAQVQSKFDAVREQLKDHFPAEPEEIKFLSLTIGAGESSSTASHQFGGFSLRRLSASGQPELVARVMNDLVTFNVLLYTRWAKVGPQAEAILNALSMSLIPDGPAVKGISLRFIDRFNWTGKDDEPEPALLIKRESSFVFPKAFEAGKLWHCNTGWFAQAQCVGGKILNQFGIQSAIREGRLAIVIDHNQLYQSPTPLDARQLFSGEEKSLFRGITNELHWLNKEVLGATLVDAAQQRIGLYEK